MSRLPKRRKSQRSSLPSWTSVSDILESVTDAFSTWDKNSRYIYVNERAVQLLGKPRDQLIGQCVWDVFPQAVGTEAYHKCQQAMTERVALSFEAFFPNLNKWYENHLYPTKEGLSIYWRDITERKRTEAALRYSEAYLAEGQRMSHTGTWALNISTGELFWSDEHFRICGVDRKSFKLTLEAARQFIHPDDQLASNQDFDRAIHERTNFERDLRIVRPDGTVRHVHSLARPVFNQAGELTEYVGTILDTTERKEEEAARNELRRRLLVAQEEERKRVSLELHDSTGQLLAALRWKMVPLERALAGHDPELSKLAKDSLVLLDELSREVRTVSHLLHPPFWEDAGLSAALRGYVEGLAERSGLHVQLNLDPDLPRLPRHVEAVVFRIVQESLTNIHRYAQAKTATVRISQEHASVRVEIQDQGRGIANFTSLNDATFKSGIGIQGMRERVEQLKGRFELQSGKEGTIVIVVLPTGVTSRDSRGA
jgi:PAS domain S-box-containing protein